jgi:hypothetical protein
MKRIARTLDIFIGREGTIVLLERGKGLAKEKIQLAGLSVAYPGKTMKSLSEAEKEERNERQVKIIRKEDVTSRLSVQPFLDWLKSAGLVTGTPAQEQNA